MAPPALYKLIADNFGLEEIEVLCRELGVDYENLGSRSKLNKALDLQQFMERRGRLAELAQAVAAARPHLDLRPWGGPAPRSAETPSATEAPAAAPPVSTPVPPHPAPVERGFRYRNLDVRIRSALADGRYPLQVTDSPAGESREVLQRFPLDDPAFQEQLANLTELFSQPEEAKHFGQLLRDLLFPPELWSRLDSSLNRLEPHEGLRIRLKIDPPELSRLPWEYCYDETRHFMATDPRTPIVRYVDEPFAAERLGAPDPLQVLVALASPSELPPVSVSEEAERIRTALAPLGNRVAVRVLEHATWPALQRALLDGAQVFHFVGHGFVNEAGRGALALEREQGGLHAVDADSLLVLFRSRGVKVVVLNACQTSQPAEGEAIMGVAPALVRAQIPAVLAMQFAVPNQTALGFTTHLYDFLSRGEPLDRAVTEMRVAAFGTSSDRLDWGIPVLFMRAPDGVIWQGNNRAQEEVSSSHSPGGSSMSEADKPVPGESDRRPAGGVSLSAISNSNISIGGHLVGGDLTIGQEPATSEPPTLPQLILLVESLRQMVVSVAGLPPGDAQDVANDLNEAHTLLGTAPPDVRRAARRLESVAAILASSGDHDAGRVLNQVNRARTMAKLLGG